MEQPKVLIDRPSKSANRICFVSFRSIMSGASFVLQKPMQKLVQLMCDNFIGNFKWLVKFRLFDSKKFKSFCTEMAPAAHT